MSNMKLTMNVVKGLRNLADSIEDLLSGEVASKNEEKHKSGEKESKVEISFEDVRAVLADLTREGKQKEVKELITSYGAKKLSDVPEEKYQEVLDKARKI